MHSLLCSPLYNECIDFQYSIPLRSRSELISFSRDLHR